MISGSRCNKKGNRVESKLQQHVGLTQDFEFYTLNLHVGLCWPLWVSTSKRVSNLSATLDYDIRVSLSVAFPFYAYSTLKHTPVWETTQSFHGLRRLLAPPAFYEFAKPQTKLPLCTFMFFIAVFSLTSYFLSRLWTWNSLQNSLQSF